ncbi:DNA polymerase III subunit chi [Candidatus Albibeggiatoa sp. nov. NOAA]|uniref:DNA polymerase III subunit chi n=1 Tax=Candidatus Albibeggiatoa sp. nov. NOAA TaxID=3162724 RepID=UPI0032FE1826|nr:DNA polymerase III subunit chi [Thiotrichaceae bacterium]
MSEQPQVDFYILQQPTGERFTCQLVDKVWHQGYQIYIHTHGLTHAKKLDDMLWTFKQDSFIPHDLYPDEADSIAPIKIGYAVDSYAPADVLVNLAVADIPDFYSNFNRVAEIVFNNDVAKQWGRLRYKSYKDKGLDVKVHNL